MTSSPTPQGKHARRVAGGSRRRGFTLVELLVVIAVMSILAIVAIPQILRARTKALLKEAQANIMNIATEMERYYTEGAFCYFTAGSGEGTSCPGTKTFVGNGTVVGSYPISLLGDFYSYTIETFDNDGDILCEAYTITATPLYAPVTSEAPLTYTSLGQKGGPWR